MKDVHGRVQLYPIVHMEGLLLNMEPTLEFLLFCVIELLDQFPQTLTDNPLWTWRLPDNGHLYLYLLQVTPFSISKPSFFSN